MTGPKSCLVQIDSATNEQLDALLLEREEVHGPKMIQAIHEFTGRFIAYPNTHAHVAHALWCVHTHLMDVWESTPRIAFLSPEPASGKTRALEVTELLVPNPVATVNVTVAYLIRKVGAECGATILFDEIDTVFGPKAKDNEEIRGLLNAGHRRGATTGRCVVRGKTIETEELPAYAPVAMAGIGWLPDTILSRSIVIRMRRRHAGERVASFRRRTHEPEGSHLRGMIETWAKANKDNIELLDLPAEIDDRDADVWESLIAVADAIGGDWPRLARAAGVAFVTASREVELSLGIRLLSDMRTVFGDSDELASKALLVALQNLDEAPWADMKGKPLDERGLAYRLRQYGVRSKTIRIGAVTAKGYTKADLFDAWTRYVPAPPAASVTSVTSETATPHKGSAVTNVTDVTDLSANGGDHVGRGQMCRHCGEHGETLECSVNGETVRLHSECIRHWTQQ